MEYKVKNRDKFVVIVAITLMIFLALNMACTIYYMIDYQKRVYSGNDRWKQVEQIINNIENRVDTLEKEIIL